LFILSLQSTIQRRFGSGAAGKLGLPYTSAGFCLAAQRLAMMDEIALRRKRRSAAIRTVL
jgi:hypothetical protein